MSTHFFIAPNRRALGYASAVGTTRRRPRAVAPRMRARPLDDAEDIVRRARDDDADASTSSATASARETLERFFFALANGRGRQTRETATPARRVRRCRRVSSARSRASVPPPGGSKNMAEAIERARGAERLHGAAPPRVPRTSSDGVAAAARLMFTWWFRGAIERARESEREPEAHELRSLQTPSSDSRGERG